MHMEKYFVLPIKCISLLIVRSQTYIFFRAWDFSSRYGVSGKYLRRKKRYSREGTFFRR